MTTAQLDNFDALLDTHYDDIPDLPKYATFPTALLKLRCTKVEIVPPKDDKEATIQLTSEFLELGEPIDEATTTVPVPPVGSLMFANFTGPKGVQRLKEVFKDVMVSLNVSTPRELLDQLSGVEYFGMNQLRSYADKVTGEKKFVNNLTMAAIV